MASKVLRAVMVAAVAGLFAGSCFAQGYPAKPIRVITSEAGGGSDFVSRVIVQGVSMGQPFVIDNRGGNNVILGQLLVQSAPDGYTILINNSGVLIAPLMQDEPRYDAARDFGFVTYAAGAPNLLVVHPSVPVKSVSELIALAKAKPATLNYGSGGTGTSNHIAAELFRSMAGVDMVHVPYKGTGPALNAIMGGQVQVLFPPINSVTAHVKAGRLTALAVTSAQPSALAPGYPTIASSGLAGYEAVSMYGVYIAPRTPKPIIARLNAEIVRALQRPDIKEKLFNSGTEAVGSSPEELATRARAEIVRVGQVLKRNMLRGG